MAHERVLTLGELNRALLERQLLLQRRRLSVQETVERLCALQAQYSPSPYLALWSRLEGFKKEQLTRALEQKRVVRSSLFRITLHITSARDYPYFAAVWLRAALASTPRLDNDKVAEASRAVTALATKQPITIEELEELGADTMGAFRWRARALAPLLHIPPSGTWRFFGPPRLRSLKAWLGVDLPAHDDGAERLVTRYLAAFGPATQEDLIRFAGVRVGDVRPGLERMRLRLFRDERGRALLDLPRAPLPDGETPAPVRFLPKWDSALLAYAPPERTRILPERLRSLVIRKNGDVLPTVLVDGFVAATWNVEDDRHLTVTPLTKLTRHQRADIDEEGERLVEFLRS